MHRHLGTLPYTRVFIYPYEIDNVITVNFPAVVENFAMKLKGGLNVYYWLPDSCCQAILRTLFKLGDFLGTRRGRGTPGVVIPDLFLYPL